jgi:hypothetical protein
MALPAQVERDLKEVEALEQQLAAQNRPAAVGTAAEDSDDDGLQTVGQSAGDESPKPSVNDERKSQSDDYEQKYRTLKGKYDAEVPRLHAQVRDLNAQMANLTQAMQEQQAQQTVQKQVIETKREPYVTDADREEYGDDLIDFQRRVAKEVAAEYDDKIARLESVINTLQTRVDVTGGEVVKMTFQQRLNLAVPDFESVNKDSGWINWLDEIDPILRGPRRGAAQEAFARGDVEAVAHYVNLFKSSRQPAVGHKSSKESELEKQVTPSRTTTAQNPAPTSTGHKVYSERELNGAWDRVTTLNKAGRYDEATKLEAELSNAMLEGRVR